MNVLEHVKNPPDALSSVHNLVSDSGSHFHVCPNYAFPCEPHFGMPLLPFSPDFTRFVFPKRIKGTGLWASINFITHRKVSDWARKNGARITFSNDSAAEAFVRLSDPIFTSRHKSVRELLRLLPQKLVLRILKSLPARLISPMQFVVTKV